MFYNNECFGERINMSEEYHKRSKESLKLHDKLLEILNDDQKKLFSDYSFAEIGVYAESEFVHFKEGMKIGFLLAVECLS